MQPQYRPGDTPQGYRPIQGPAEPDAPYVDKDGMDCPECGKHLVDMAHRRKEAQYHYGSDNIPRYPNHDTAAQRKGQLLNVDPATLRG